MPASGTVNSRIFTPDADCRVIVTATFNAQSSGSDFGSNALYKAFLTQNGVTTYGQELRLSSARVPYVCRSEFTAVAGLLAEAGLFGRVTGATTENFWDVEIILELIKR